MDFSREAIAQEQTALWRLYQALLAEPDSRLFPTLYQGFLDELGAHVREFDGEVFPAVADLSLSARLLLQELHDEHEQLLSQIRPDAGGLQRLGEPLRAHFDRELELLEPLLRRRATLASLSRYTVGPTLRVEHWSAELAQRTSVSAEEAVSRPLEEILPRLRGGSPLALVLPFWEGGATVWYPPWAERPGALGLEQVREVAETPLRPSVANALRQLRDTVAAQASEVVLLDPPGRSERRFFWEATEELRRPRPELAAQVMAERRPLTWSEPDHGSSAWVPLWGAHQVIGAMGLHWNGECSLLETPLLLLQWAATPLAILLEPLLDALRHPGRTSIPAEWARQVLG